MLQITRSDITALLIPGDYLFPDEPLFVRKYEDKLLVDYLISSDQVLFPTEYINLISILNSLDQTQLPLWNFTFYFNFYNSLYGRKYEISMREMLANIVKSGSKDFRNFIKLEYDFELEPLIIRNTIEQKQI